MAQVESAYGLRLRAARRDKGLTLRELGERTGADFTSLSHLEHGRFTPSARLGQALTDVLGVDLLPPGDLAVAKAILRDVAALSPWVSHPDGRACFFCGQSEWETPEHKANCAWLRARQA